MPTVQIRTQPIRPSRRMRAALLCSVVLACVHGGAARAQVLGALRGEADQQLFVINQTTGKQADEQTGSGSIPATVYQPASEGALPQTDTTDTKTDAGDTGVLDPETTASIADTTEEEPATLPEKNPYASPEGVKPVKKTGPLQGKGVAPEAEPFAPRGIRLGSFILRPSVELGLTGQRETTTSQTGAPPTVTESTANTLFGDATLRLNLASDWDRHAFNVNASGRLQRTFSGGGVKLEPEVKVNANGRIDLGTDTTISATFGYGYKLEDAQSAAYNAATDSALIPAVTGVNKPATQTLDGSVAVRQQFGRAFGEAEASASRSTYGDARLSDDTTIPQGDLDNTVVQGRLRAGFEVSPALSPYMEASYGVRRMDTTPDSGGYDRNGLLYALRLGTEIDLGEKLNGDISAGYAVEDVADPALKDIAGVSVNAALNWSPRRETDVKLALSTTTEAGVAAGDSGALLYSADLGITHRARANLTMDANLGLDYRDARGVADEITLAGTVSTTYWFNRFAGMTMRLGHERKLSSDPTKRSNKSTAFLGLTLQR